MKNRDIYQTDPSQSALANQGVANVNDEATEKALSVLRYELTTFVCDGQYKKGMAHILETFLSNINKAEQPGVWVSGFYGSGKSHLVKMLRALWVDTPFSDGASARGLARLPQDIQDHLKELTTQGRRHGGLHAASGTLGAAASGSVRLALLRIIFKSAGLPEQYPVARLVIWLRDQGIEEAVRQQVEACGYDWEEELDNFTLAEGLHAALVAAKPNIFSTVESCADVLSRTYPHVSDISNEEMTKAIRQALTKEGQFPLTLVVLDEVQQYIGTDGQRSIDVQEVVETACKQFAGKLLFIGTGQTAVTGTTNLKKLEGRFTVRLELSDADVDAVVRQVILAKKPQAREPVQQVMETNLGEISRHLSGSTLAHQQADINHFSQDYPILPVRRRFWENTLRVLDQTGTDSQLRNQLSLVHKVIQTNLDAPLGHVITADYLYFESADRMIQSHTVPRRLYEKTLSWINGNADEKLTARACAVVFLINKLNGSNQDIGIRATTDTIADLLVEDLVAGSSGLRAKLPALLDHCDQLIKVGNEYRIQTEESAAWMDEFLNQRSALGNEAYRIDNERDDRIRRTMAALAKNIRLTQGQVNESRQLQLSFDASLPADANKHIYAWVRDGWSTDANNVKADARQAGNQAPTLFVFLPKRAGDDLRTSIMDFKAASATLEKRGIPSSAEGKEAYSAMETTKQTAEARIKELLQDAFSGAQVFQAGGTEVTGNNLQDMLSEAANNALKRLYPQFAQADHSGWGKAYEKAKKGAPDALKAVGHEGDVASHAVCKAILSIIGAGKTGTDIRNHFEAAPYGWPGDAIDGGLQTLLVAGLIRADDGRQPIKPTELERKSIGKAHFNMESVTLTTAQRIKIRKLLQQLGITCQSGEESPQVPAFLQALNTLADSAGGDAPQPTRPDTAFIDTLRQQAGNEQLLALSQQKDGISQHISQWQTQAADIQKRLPAWQQLTQLLSAAHGLEGQAQFQAQASTISQQRQLLDSPDPVAPLISQLSQALRVRLNQLDAQYQQCHQQGMARLEQDANWAQLTPEQRNKLLGAQRLTLADTPKVAVTSTQDILTTLGQMPLTSFNDRITALSGAFEAVAKRAAELCEPQVQFVRLPTRTLKSQADISAWLQDAENELNAALAKGPVSVR